MGVPAVQVRYHEEFEKKIKGSKIEVVDDPESRRLKRLGSLVSQVEYKKQDSTTTTTDPVRRTSLTHWHGTSVCLSVCLSCLSVTTRNKIPPPLQTP